MSELRDRMIRDMTVRGFARRTHTAYIAAVVRSAKHYRRSPDQITSDEVQTYLAHLIHERKLSWSTCSQAANAFRFLYHVTLGHPRTEFHVPLPKQPQRLPEILSREEVWHLLTVPLHPRHRLLLTTVYAAGLRVSEAIALKVSDIDADRIKARMFLEKHMNLVLGLRACWRSSVAPWGVSKNHPGGEDVAQRGERGLRDQCGRRGRGRTRSASRSRFSEGCPRAPFERFHVCSFVLDQPVESGRRVVGVARP